MRVYCQHVSGNEGGEWRLPLRGRSCCAARVVVGVCFGRVAAGVAVNDVFWSGIRFSRSHARVQD